LQLFSRGLITDKEIAKEIRKQLPEMAKKYKGVLDKILKG